MPAKKVLFVATVRIHIETFHLPYLNYFKQQGYEVHVAANDTENCDTNIPYCDVFYNVPFSRSPIDSINRQAYKQLKDIIHQQDYALIHCHTPVGSALTRLAAKKVRKSGTKVIYSAHGFHFYQGSPAINWLTFYPIEKHLSRYTDALITSNREDFDLSTEKFKKTTTYLTHGVGLKTERLVQSDLTPQQMRDALQLQDDDIACMFIGELNENKNQKMIIDAINQLKNTFPNLHLFLVGDGTNREVLEKLVEEYSLQNQVHFLGYRSDIGSLLPAMNFYVSSSQREGLGLNIVEALYCNLPAIITDIRGHRDVVTNGENGLLVPSNDSNALADAITRLLNDKQLMQKLQANAKQSTTPFLLDSTLQEHIQIYEKTLHSLK